MKYTKVTFVALVVIFELLPVDKNFLVRATMYPIFLLLSTLAGYILAALEDRNFYKTVYEDLHVISKHPTTGAEFSFGGDLAEANKYIFNVDYHKVRKTAARLRNDLRQAGNPNINEALDPAQRVDVHTYIFQEGGRVNETWPEFCEYVAEEIKANRSARHELMFNNSYEWYISNHEKQDL
jgi:hypothetical protein